MHNLVGLLHRIRADDFNEIDNYDKDRGTPLKCKKELEKKSNKAGFQ